MHLPVQVPDRASSSADVRSFSGPAVPAVIHRVPARRRALLASLQAVVPCIPPAPRLAAPRVAVPASANGQAAQVAVPASASVLAVPVVLAADWCRPRAKRRVLSVRVVHHAVVDVSSTRRPKKAR